MPVRSLKFGLAEPDNTTARLDWYYNCLDPVWPRMEKIRDLLCAGVVSAPLKRYATINTKDRKVSLS